MNNIKQGDYLSTTKISELLQVSIATINRWLNVGEIPFIRTVGGFKRVLASDLVVYMRKKSYSIPSELKFEEPRIIYLIEDNISVENKISKWLSNLTFAYELCTFKNAFVALTNIATRRPFVIIMDLLLPGINCIQLMKSLKENKTTHEIRFIAIANNPKFKNNVNYKELDLFFNINNKPEKLINKIVDLNEKI